MFDEKKARNVITTMMGLEGKPGVDVMLSLKDDVIKVNIERYGKRLVSTKIDTRKISEQTNDELTYWLFSWRR